MNRSRRSRFSPLMLIGFSVTMIVALIGVGAIVVLPRFQSHAAAAANPNCTLILPNNPLTAQGLATPYQIVATNAGNGPCNEGNANQSVFVMADIIDPATGQITNYNPLVIDKGTKPAVAPTMPTIPANAVVGIWFGFNGTTMTLQGGAQGQCVNGSANSPFGQFAYCNAPNFFQAANNAIQAGMLKVPALGTASDGQPCQTTRSFALVDMDQSDNVQTQYLVNGNGQTAQLTAANQAALPNATVLGNPSDNALLTKFVDPALGCTPWTVPDLANNNTPIATYGTDELMAAADQQAPIALVPGGDPMVLANNNQSLNKVNLYRAGADQTPAASLNGNAATDANTTTYCQNLVNVALPRLQLDMNTFQNKPSPDNGATATTLFGFLANRLNAALGANGLNCTGLLNIQNPVTLTTDGNGVVTSATIMTKPQPANAANNGNANNGTTNTATGTINATLDTNAGNAPVDLKLNIANFANQQFFVNITDSATGKQILHQMEDTDGNGANNASTVINGLQGLTAIPNTWVATITDNNGNALGSAPFVSQGTTAVATLTATSTATTAATTTPATGAATTAAAGAATTAATPTATTAAGAATTAATPTATPAAGAATTAATPTATPAAGAQTNQAGNGTHHHHN